MIAIREKMVVRKWPCSLFCPFVENYFSYLYQYHRWLLNGRRRNKIEHSLSFSLYVSIFVLAHVRIFHYLLADRATVSLRFAYIEKKKKILTFVRTRTWIIKRWTKHMAVLTRKCLKKSLTFPPLFLMSNKSNTKNHNGQCNNTPTAISTISVVR